MGALVRGCLLRYRVSVVILIVMLGVTLASCDFGVRKRPFGFMELGNVLDLRSPQIFFPEKRLLLRRDKDGFYVMSTQCTHDLSTLIFKETEEEARFFSPWTSSVYDEAGNVLQGPAKRPLPYFRLDHWKNANGEVLVAVIGDEVPASWRLKLKSSPWL